MKKFLMVMGAVFCGLIVLLVIGVIFVAVRGTRLDKESRAYADATIAAIVTTWNEDAFFERASPELKRLMSANDGDRLFLRLRELGHLKHCDSAQGQSMTSAVLGQPRRTTARYEAVAEFEKAEARIVVELIKHGDRWQMLAFQVNSPLFVPK